MENQVWLCSQHLEQAHRVHFDSCQSLESQNVVGRVHQLYVIV